MTGRSPTLHEELFAPRTVEDVLALTDALKAYAGAGDGVAAGCAMWVARRASGARADDGLAMNTRLKYRKLLAELLDAGWTPPGSSNGGGRVVELDSRRRTRRDQSGRVRPAITAFASVVMLAGGSLFGPAARALENVGEGHSPLHQTPIGAPGAPERPVSTEEGQPPRIDDDVRNRRRRRGRLAA